MLFIFELNYISLNAITILFLYASLKKEPGAHVALVTRSEPKIRLSTRVIDLVVPARREPSTSRGIFPNSLVLSISQ